LLLTTIGRYLEAIARTAASASLNERLRLGSDTSEVIRDGVRVTVPVPQILVGDVLRIAPGRALPTDARVTTKGGSVSLAVLNGEADPKDVVPGDDVPAGAIVERMALEVVATRDPRDSTLARLAALVEQARQRRSRVERLA